MPNEKGQKPNYIAVVAGLALLTIAQTALAAEDSKTGVWSAVPSILWIIFALAVLLKFRRQIDKLIDLVIERVRLGASMKIWAVELGAVQHVSQMHTPSAPVGLSAHPENYRPEAISGSGENVIENRPLSPEAFFLNDERKAYYRQTHKIMLVHRLFRSTKPDQVYDVLIYLIPHGKASLVEVTNVKYFLGRYWGNEVFSSNDRSQGFPILTSAYGTFLCCAQVAFNDGTTQTLYRYIDFETGATAPILPSSQGTGQNEVERKKGNSIASDTNS